MDGLKLPLPVEWSIVLAIVFYLAKSVWQLIEQGKAKQTATVRSDRTHEDMTATCSREVLTILQQQTQILAAAQQTLTAIASEQQRQARTLTAIAALHSLHEEV
jgi:hypothetical protein